jgi:IS1 family transposase
MSQLSLEQQVRVIAALTEGCSIRSIERLTEIHRDSIMRLGVRVGEGCARLHDRVMQDLQVNLIEMDEQWAFIAKKQKHLNDGDPAYYGDVWVFTALAATQKAVISYVVGKRTSENALALAADLRARIMNRPQITADGYSPYIGALRQAFGGGRGCDFAQLIKTYEATPGNDSATRYSPGRIRSIEKEPVFGNPVKDLVSTSYVERFNLTNRMAIPRFTRLTNAFSKKFENHQAAVSLHIAHYNLCRVHETLRTTPAMALGVTNHIWAISELIDAALTAPKPAPTLPVSPAPLRPSPRGFQLRVIRGGKAGS